MYQQLLVKYPFPKNTFVFFRFRYYAVFKSLIFTMLTVLNAPNKSTICKSQKQGCALCTDVDRLKEFNLLFACSGSTYQLDVGTKSSILKPKQCFFYFEKNFFFKNLFFNLAKEASNVKCCLYSRSHKWTGAIWSINKHISVRIMDLTRHLMPAFDSAYMSLIYLVFNFLLLALFSSLVKHSVLPLFLNKMCINKVLFLILHVSPCVLCSLAVVRI